ncbi:MAG: YDG domain-containing protein [Streptococcaceae bacterium]|jgi:hypothetical protein|nr:YDG domain-containing protein [Streptococcaceae bacterium]
MTYKNKRLRKKKNLKLKLISAAMLSSMMLGEALPVSAELIERKENEQTTQVIPTPAPDLPTFLPGADLTTDILEENPAMDPAPNAETTPPQPRATTRFSGGDGSVTNPYQIATPSQLQEMANDLSAHYILIDDIDMSGQEWTPIGATAESQSFSGSFDGDGKSINNLTITKTSAGTGLFAATARTSVIRDIHFNQVSIQGVNYTGTLVGLSRGTIINATVYDGFVRGTSQTGGLVGGQELGSITESHTQVAVSGTTQVGGLAGLLSGGSEEVSVSESSAHGQVTATGNNAGGLLGYMSGLANLTRSYANGNVTTPGNNAGGLVGSVVTNAGVRVSISYATGSVSGANNVGGLVGYLANATLENIYTRGEEIFGNSFVGGVVGGASNGSRITRSYTTSAVKGSTYVGGILGGRNGSGNAYVGYNFFIGSLSATDTYGAIAGSNSGVQSATENYRWSGVTVNNVLITGNPGNINGTAVSAEALQTQNSYTQGISGAFNPAWNFNNTWVWGPDDFPIFGIGDESGANPFITIRGEALSRVYDGRTINFDITDIFAFHRGATHNDYTYRLRSDAPDGTILEVSGDNVTLSFQKIGVFWVEALDSNDMVVAEGEIEITPRPVTLVEGHAHKLWDGTTSLTDANVTLPALDPDTLIDGDDIRLKQAGDLHFASSAVGKTTVLGGYWSLTGTDVANYVLTEQPIFTGEISPDWSASITVSQGLVENKNYDSTDAAVIHTSPVITISGLQFRIHFENARFENQYVGTEKPVYGVGEFTLEALSGISIPEDSLEPVSNEINRLNREASLFRPASITNHSISTISQDNITKGSVSNRTYDATDLAKVETQPTLTVTIGETEHTATLVTEVRFDEKNAGERKVIVTDLIFSGTSDFVLTAEALEILNHLTLFEEATIYPAQLTWSSGRVADKTYDATTHAEVLEVPTLIGIFENDSVTISEGTVLFAQSDAGENIDILPTGWGISGADAANYTLAKVTPQTLATMPPQLQARAIESAETLQQPDFGTASITPRQINFTGTITASKTFDGTASFEDEHIEIAHDWDGLIYGDALSLNVSELDLNHENESHPHHYVGVNNFTLSSEDITLQGASAHNYELTGDIAVQTAITQAQGWVTLLNVEEENITDSTISLSSATLVHPDSATPQIPLQAASRGMTRAAEVASDQTVQVAISTEPDADPESLSWISEEDFDGTFTGLEPDTTYYIYAFAGETHNFSAGETSIIAVTTDSFGDATDPEEPGNGTENGNGTDNGNGADNGNGIDNDNLADLEETPVLDRVEPNVLSASEDLPLLGDPATLATLAGGISLLTALGLAAFLKKRKK